MFDAADAPPAPTTFEAAIAVLESTEVEPDPNAPSCLEYRLRPSEIAAILQERAANPPPPWGKKISLAKSFIGPEKYLALAHKLILNRTVTFLDLSMCDLQEKAAPEFFSCIQRSKVLRHLNVTGNNIGDSGALAAAPCVLQLESLHLGSNDITDVGAAALATAVAVSTKIKALNVRANRITRYGVYKLLMALEDVSSQLSPELLSSVQDKERERSIVNPVPTCSPQASLSEYRASAKGSVSELLLASHRGGALPKSPVADATTESSQPSLFSGQTQDAASCEPVFPAPIEEKPEPTYNETLNVLWVDNNVDIPAEMHTVITAIMAKRFPPPPPKPKKKKGKKSDDGGKKK